MDKIEYPFVIYPAEEGGYVAEIPALKVVWLKAKLWKRL